jgi:hypothetical protein
LQSLQMKSPGLGRSELEGVDRTAGKGAKTATSLSFGSS